MESGSEQVVEAQIGQEFQNLSLKLDEESQQMYGDFMEQAKYPYSSIEDHDPKHHVYPKLYKLCCQMMYDKKAAISKISCNHEICTNCLTAYLTSKTSYLFIQSIVRGMGQQQDNNGNKQFKVEDFGHFEIYCPIENCEHKLTIDDYKTILADISNKRNNNTFQQNFQNQQ